MNKWQKLTLAVLIFLLLAAVAGIVITGDWRAPQPQTQSSSTSPAPDSTSANAETLVDQQPLKTAQQLARLATTPEEQPFAQEALRLGDQEVDLAFAQALRNAIAHPPAPTPETREILARIDAAQQHIETEQSHVTQLEKSIAAANGGRKDDLEQQLDLMQAQLDLDEDELTDAQGDLTRAGGDKQTLLQRMYDEHQAASKNTAAAAASGQSAATSATPSASPSPTSTTWINASPNSLLAKFENWQGVRAKEFQLIAAQNDAKTKASQLTSSHESIAMQLHPKTAAKPSNAASGHPQNANTPSAPAQPAAPPAATPPAAQATPPATPPAAATTTPPPPADASTQISHLKQLAQLQKDMASYDKRIEAEKDLATTYGQWIQLVDARRKSALHTLLISVAWVLIVGILVFSVDSIIERYFSKLPVEERRLRTLRSVVRFGIEIFGALIILLIFFGPPGQLGTVVALAGAGLTVALKDFIIGFLGWFVLMGKNGIRVGDWVEIEGVGGEVVEIGLLHTVLLETGNWTEAGHPTGRRVSFVNSYAIEGHYFNFSTSGQWLWDELQVFIPSSEDPAPIAQGMQKLVAQSTSANARLAEQEWQQVTTTHGLSGFSAEPAVSVRPTSGGIEVTVRYITRANERHDVRSKLYEGVIGMLQHKNAPQAVVTAAAAEVPSPGSSPAPSLVPTPVPAPATPSAPAEKK